MNASNSPMNPDAQREAALCEAGGEAYRVVVRVLGPFRPKGAGGLVK